MQQKLGIFGLSIMLVFVSFGLFDYLPPIALQTLAIIGSVTVLLGIYLILRSMAREARALTAYDRSLQRAASESGMEGSRPDAQTRRTDAESLTGKVAG